MVNVINSKVKVEIGLFQKKKTGGGGREGWGYGISGGIKERACEISWG